MLHGCSHVLHCFQCALPWLQAALLLCPLPYPPSLPPLVRTPGRLPGAAVRAACLRPAPLLPTPASPCSAGWCAASRRWSAACSAGVRLLRACPCGSPEPCAACLLRPALCSRRCRAWSSIWKSSQGVYARGSAERVYQVGAAAVGSGKSRMVHLTCTWKLHIAGVRLPPFPPRTGLLLGARALPAAHGRGRAGYARPHPHPGLRRTSEGHRGV